MLKRCFFLVVIVVNLNLAQEIFHIEVEEFIPFDDRDIHYLPRIYDLDSDGIKEVIIIKTRSIEGERYDFEHCLSIFEDGEESITTDWEPGGIGRGPAVFIADINRDGHSDIFIEASQIHRAELYAGPEYELDRSDFWLFPEYITAGFTGFDANGEITPFFMEWVCDFDVWDDSLGRGIELFEEYTNLYTGSPFINNYEFRHSIGLPYGICTYENEYRRSADYFISSRWSYLYSHPDTVWNKWEVYQAWTSLGSTWDNPRCLTLFDMHDLRENQHGEERTASHWFRFSDNNAVEDFDGDGRVEWVLPWYCDAEPDTYITHTPVYDPEDFILISDYIEAIPGIGYLPFTSSAHKGAYPIDVDNDGDYELIIGLLGLEPRIIEPLRGDLILVGDEPLPTTCSFTFYLGKFLSDRENLQLMVYTNQRLELYHLPVNWTMPNKVQDSFSISPNRFILDQAYPNPFNAATTLSYTLPRPMDVELSVWDATGRKISVLDRGKRGGGEYRLHWRADGFSSGVYFVRLKGKDCEDVRKVNLVR